MVDGDSMGPVLQLVGALFSNFLLDKLSREFKLRGRRYFTKFKWPYFGTAWGYSQTVGHADSTTCIVHADVTLTRSKVKVKVMGLLKFWKLHCSRCISSTILACGTKLMIDDDSMWTCLQPVWGRFSNFLLSKLSQEFKLRGMSRFSDIQMAIFRYCVTIQSHGWARWSSYRYCACRFNIDPTQGRGQVHGASEFPKIAENCTFLGLSRPAFQRELKSDGWSW